VSQTPSRLWLLLCLPQVGTQATQLKDAKVKMKKMKTAIDKLREDKKELEEQAASLALPVPSNFRIRTRVQMDRALSGSRDQSWCFIEYDQKVLPPLSNPLYLYVKHQTTHLSVRGGEVGGVGGKNDHIGQPPACVCLQEVKAWEGKSSVPWYSQWVPEDVAKDWLEQTDDGLDDIAEMPPTLQESFQA
jgi:hypothetical protein